MGGNEGDRGQGEGRRGEGEYHQIITSFTCSWKQGRQTVCMSVPRSPSF